MPSAIRATTRLPCSAPRQSASTANATSTLSTVSGVLSRPSTVKDSFSTTSDRAVMPPVISTSPPGSSSITATESMWSTLSIGGWKCFVTTPRRLSGKVVRVEAHSSPIVYVHRISLYRVGAGLQRRDGCARHDTHGQVAREGQGCGLVPLLPRPPLRHGGSDDAPLEPAALRAKLYQLHQHFLPSDGSA